LLVPDSICEQAHSLPKILASHARRSPLRTRPPAPQTASTTSPECLFFELTALLFSRHPAHRAISSSGAAFALLEGAAARGSGMNGLGGLNKSPDGVMFGLVQLQLPGVVTSQDLARQT
jgi:hypothetical protein